MDDAEEGDGVLAAARDGAEWALTALYRAHHRTLVRFLEGFSRDDAEDLAAETWIDAARALRTFEGDDRDFRRLLFTIARRRAIDHRRKRIRRRTDPTDNQILEASPNHDDPGELVADHDASRQAVRRISRLLPRDQAEVILLRVVAGLGVQEVAQIVGRSPAAVSVLQTRGLQRLAQRLGDDPARWKGET
jgi:RNA polymerase sigma-70 factor (ECF subfamily)